MGEEIVKMEIGAVVNAKDIPAAKRQRTSALVEAYDKLTVGQALTVTGKAASIRSAVRYHKQHDRLKDASVIVRDGVGYVIKTGKVDKPKDKKKGK